MIRPKKPKPILHVPFDVKGHMLTYTNQVYPATAAAPREWAMDAASWRDGVPFTARLRIERFERGRSASHFIWRDDAEHEYTMFGQYLIDALQKHNLTGGWLNGTWGYVKRGANYSIVKLDEISTGS